MVDIVVDTNLVDVGYGMPIQISSVFGGGAAPPHLIPAADVGAPFFRTDVEASPSITIDLACIRHVARIRVFNNEGEPLRGVPLAVSISADAITWSTVLVTHADFGGKVTNAPLVVPFRYFALCRYVKLQSLAEGSLRLHYVEICAPLPHEYFGKLRNIRVTDADIVADYWHHDSYGFAWTFTCTLGMILSAHLLGVTIDQVNYRLCMHAFKERADDDAYAWLFESRTRRSRDLPAELPSFDRHGVYASFPLGTLSVYAQLYFRPHERVRTYANHLAAQYGLVLSKTVVLFYRGTDKTIEIEPATPESYASVAQALIAREPGLRVLIQTDQAQARTAILAVIAEAVWFSELPVTEGSRAIHQLDVTTELNLTKADLALRLLAVTWLAAQARYVVTHTGNLGAWVAIYRGRADGLYQFCADGRLRGPDGHELSRDLEPVAG